MKKILIINSSPRDNGNCAILCDEFGRGAITNTDNEVSRIDLRSTNMNFYQEEQPEDDIAGIAHQIADSNVIVLATPVYFYNMSGQLKTFIDRMMPYFNEVQDKDFYYILTAAVNRREMESTAEALNGFTDSLPGSNVRYVIYAHNVSNKGDVLNRQAMQEAFQVASRIK